MNIKIIVIALAMTVFMCLPPPAAAASAAELLSWEEWITANPDKQGTEDFNAVQLAISQATQGIDVGIEEVKEESSREERIRLAHEEVRARYAAAEEAAKTAPKSAPSLWEEVYQEVEECMAAAYPCWEEALPDKCKSLHFSGAESDQRFPLRTLFVCVNTCEKAGLYSRTFGECSS
jgi:hypothetical protein